MNLLRFFGIFLIPTCVFAQKPVAMPKKPVPAIYGKWQSKDDEKVIYDFMLNGKVIQYYDGQKMTEEKLNTYAACTQTPCLDTLPKTKQPHKTAVKPLQKNSCFTLKGNFETNCYKIIRLDNAAFQYTQFGSSTKFSFIRVKADEKPPVVKAKEVILPPAPPKSKVVQDSVKTTVVQDTMKAKVVQDTVKLKMPSKSKPKKK
ncbi:MAG: hypothetical protein RL329_3268 [Bacteroidota bacterium]|jgi:hypothetical protein